MIKRDTLVEYLQTFLACDAFQDYAPNGLQIEGKRDIFRICTAVTASFDVIAEAIAYQADALLVHHGYFWRGESVVITGIKRSRIAALMQHDINLMAYHLPLDCHIHLGNNACLSRLLPLKNITQHKINNVPNLLWMGVFDTPILASSLSLMLQEKLARTPLLIEGGETPIKTVAWCSGAAADYIDNAHALGADAFISGEVSERTYYQAKELGIHYFACGHHATERAGIRALGEHLAAQFSLEHHFIDSDNPV